ncbi:hypothetical protein FE374_13200 [Georgenia yuyongxinii]|uniref:Exo-alpha-sialidase n=1 Tax=Georgenia yuyongxinii TaxID=2589797 RepID=A0A5B8C3V0_9MICO|nr:hypothetical protein [Georgenia yuyongxinii]QDC25439.1 hypothetical protein FE374_13200 [Georgenia yuyongxinii]
MTSLVALLALAGCTSGQAESAPPPDQPSSQRIDVPLTEVALPPETRSTGPAAWSWTLLPGHGTRPVPVAVGVVEEPGRPADVGVWRLDLEGAIEPGRLGIDGHVESVSGASSGEILAVAGWSSDGTQQRGFLSLAPNRRTFGSVTLGDAASAVRFDAVGVVGSTLVAVGEDVDETAWAVVVDAEDATDVRVVALPPSAAEEELTLTSASGHGDQLLVTAQLRRAGGPSTAVAYVSDDAGRTWQGPHPIAAARSAVAGAVWSGTDYVATGSAHDETRGARSPAAWSSADGLTWVAEAFDLDKFGTWHEPSDDVSLGRPIADATVTAAASLAPGRDLVAVERVAPGRWEAWDRSKPVDGADAAGMTWHSPDGDDWFLVHFANSAEVQALSPTGLLEAHPLAGTVRPARVDSVHVVDDVVGVVGSRPYFEELEEGWATGTAAAPMVLDGARVRPGPWGPDGLGQYAKVTSLAGPGVGPGAGAVADAGAGSGADADGVTVLLGAGRAGDPDVHTAGWVRTAPGAPWEAVTGITGGGFVYATHLEHVALSWYALGRVAPTLFFDEARTAMVWTSTDGRTWTRWPATTPTRATTPP